MLATLVAALYGLSMPSPRMINGVHQCAHCWCPASNVPPHLREAHPAAAYHYGFYCQWHRDYPGEILCPTCRTEYCGEGWKIHPPLTELELRRIATGRDQG